MQTADCVPCCSSPVPVNIPGLPGSDGAAGAAGQNGINAFSLTTGNFNVPANTSTDVTVPVSSSLWMVIGQILIIGQGSGATLANPGPAHFIVTAIPSSTSVTMRWKNYPGDVAAGTAISSGAVVSPSGEPFPVPMAIADGGTAATTKAGAQTSLGLGQDAIISSGNALTQDITASLVQVGAIDVTIPATGTYAVAAGVSVEMAGATFASSRAVTIEIRNITQGVTVVTTTRNTGVQTTVTLPTIDYALPFGQSATFAASDHCQIRISVAVAPSAGTFKVVAGSLIAIPLRKS